MRSLLLGWSLTVLLVGFLSTEAEARSLLLVAEGRQGSLRGELPVIHGEDGAGYVSLDRLARLLGVRPTWSRKSSIATFAVQAKSVRLTRDRSKVLVQGKPVTLRTPPRILSGGWVVPEEFLTRVLPKLYASVRVARAETKPPVKPAAASVALEDLRFRSYPSFTRVVLEGSGPFAFQIEDRGGEVRVRLSGLSLSAPRLEEVGDGLVKELRVAPLRGGAELRVILEGAPGEIKAMTLQDPYRVMVDVHRTREPAAREATGGPAEPLRRIVLDAGHGGHDPGAVGPGGLQEKDVVLDVTKRVARLVEGGLGIKVALSRTGDYFVPLRDRTQFANKERAQLFVSIHANAHRDSVSEGVETYFLSSEATDNEARQVAALENGVIQLETGNSRANMDILKTILWDLAQSEFQVESGQLAETVQDSVTRSLRIANRGVKQAGFYVLGGAAMPAVLVEIGFLTNRKEERRLMDSQYRERVARAISAGLAEYKGRYDQKMGVPQTAEGPR
ncbi:MAG: N-acetylmuramoyl-L-alanine amidase [Candidatus Rokubacteria bacterium]|nr:N-acetylmuramoyl-L-alanine amidase [Candidatus Rokubacteria bacterium]